VGGGGARLRREGDGVKVAVVKVTG